MKIKFLVQCKQEPSGDYNLICHGRYFKNLTTSAESFNGALEVMQFVLEQFMKTKGMDWIKKWKGFPGSVNCPEAYIELPSDIWKCRITREICGIQAQVPINDKKNFLALCNASEEWKEKIFQTIISEKYTGFHHIPGRYLCVQCQSDKWKKRSEHYHYPWELVSVSDCVDFSGEFKPKKSEIDDILDYEESIAFEKQLKEEGYLTLEDMLENEGLEPLAAGYGVCPKCCKRIISAVFPEINHQIKVVELDIYQR